MKTVLVTGATGGLGRNAVEYLLTRGVAVRATGRNLTIGQQLESAGAAFFPADLAAMPYDDMRPLVEGVDAVWHCAALSSPWGRREDFLRANATATENLLTAAGIESIPRFVHISTPALYFDFQHRWGIPESFLADRFVNHYAATKAAAEAVIYQQVGLWPSMKQVILRPRAIFGPHDQVLIPRLDKILSKNNGRLPLPRGGATVLDLTYVTNVVHAMWLASSAPVASGSIYNITNDDPQVLAEVLQRLFVQELGRPLKIIDVPYGLLAKVASALEFVSRFTGKEPTLTRYSIGALAFDMTLDIRRAKDELGYAPVVSMEEGIRRTAEWIKTTNNG